MSKNDIVNKVYNILRSKGRKIYKKEIKQYLECSKNEDFSPMWSKDIYVNRGSIYCEMVEKVYIMKGMI